MQRPRQSGCLAGRLTLTAGGILYIERGRTSLPRGRNVAAPKLEPRRPVHLDAREGPTVPFLYSARLRVSRAIRLSAWALVAAGVAAPVLRHRLRLPRAAVLGASAAAPAALTVAMSRTKVRDVA